MVLFITNKCWFWREFENGEKIKGSEITKIILINEPLTWWKARCFFFLRQPTSPFIPHALSLSLSTLRACGSVPKLQ